MRPLRGKGCGGGSLALVLCLALIGCGGSETASGPGDPEIVEVTEEAPVPLNDAKESREPEAPEAPESVAPEAPELPTGPEFKPSDFARKEIPKPLLRTYLGTGQLLALDWAVLAAVDTFLVDRAGKAGVVVTRERVPGLGYALLASGAPLDYKRAVGAQVGVSNAERVLKLVDRFRAKDAK